MPGSQRPFERRDERDLSDLDEILRRLDRRAVFGEPTQPNHPVISVIHPAPPPAAAPTTLIDSIGIKLPHLFSVGALLLSGGIALGTYLMNSDTKFIRLTEKIERIDRRFEALEDRFADRLAFIFTDFCRRTERRNPNWACADPIIAPLDGAANRSRRDRVGGE